MGSGEPWKLVDRLKAFNWLTWYGGKFSTSEKRGIFMDQALELLPSDYWRWYLMANAPESSDAAFTLEQFQQTINADLANVFGNFVNRITRFCGVEVRRARCRMAASRAELKPSCAQEFAERLAALTQCHEQMEIPQSRRRAARDLGRRATNICKSPRRGRRSRPIATRPPSACAPASMPASLFADPRAAVHSGRGEDRARCASACRRRTACGRSRTMHGVWDALPRGLAITPPDVLFKKIEDEQVAAWAARFCGGAG